MVWKILRQAKAFFRSEAAATATEYAVMIALVIILVILAVTAIGDKVSNSFAKTEHEWSEAVE